MPAAAIELAPERVLYEHDVLGTMVYSRLPDAYDGACQVELEGAKTRQTLGFPSVRDARLAAKFAVGELGGYLKAVLRPASAEWVTHANWSDWAFGIGEECRV